MLGKKKRGLIGIQRNANRESSLVSILLPGKIVKKHDNTLGRNSVLKVVFDNKSTLVIES